MSTLTHQRPTVGERVELGRYTLPGGQTRLVVGQRVDGVVRVSDTPDTGSGRAYLVERELERDGHAALLSLVADYVSEAERHASIPMADNVLERYLQHLDDHDGG